MVIIYYFDDFFIDQAKQEEAVLMQQMLELRGDEGAALTGSQVGAIVGMGSSEIGSAAAAYAHEQEESRKQMVRYIRGEGKRVIKTEVVASRNCSQQSNDSIFANLRLNDAFCAIGSESG